MVQGVDQLIRLRDVHPLHLDKCWLIVYLQTLIVSFVETSKVISFTTLYSQRESEQHCIDIVALTFVAIPPLELCSHFLV